jgi:ribonucleoside-diphosphate reductase alpha chain/ribonucleoside-triphosphate reductase
VKTIQECNGNLTPTACMDIANIIAKNVLVGGVRRSAQIALGSEDDDEFKDAKVGLFTLPHMKDKRHRVMSNNSLVFVRKPSKTNLTSMFERIKTSWEPGFLNFKAASKRRPWLGGVNPCGEALLSDKGNCNLSGINLMAFVKNGEFNLQAAEKAIRLVTRLGLRQTNITWSLPDWDTVHKRDRLLGVSLTGVMDAFDSLGIEFDSNKAITILQHLNNSANDEAELYAFEMRVPKPLLVCLCKPEGTISKLMTVSPGMARDRAPFYIRRIRVSELDPVCKALQEIGVPNEPDVSKPDRVVFSFPIKTKAKISANYESALRQYERYLILQKYYSDHNTSCTINVGEDEWEGLVDKIYENWDDTIACAFAAKDYSQYPQLPEEEITEAEYQKLMINFPDLSCLYDIINKYEMEYEEEFELDNECKSGHCPIR